MVPQLRNLKNVAFSWENAWIFAGKKGTYFHGSRSTKIILREFIFVDKTSPKILWKKRELIFTDLNQQS